LEENADLSKELKGRKFNFAVKQTFLTGTLQNLMEDLSISNESVLEIEYMFALDKPKPQTSTPQDEWISGIQCLGNAEKASFYAASFFNGDVKIFDSESHAEKASLL